MDSIVLGYLASSLLAYLKRAPWFSVLSLDTPALNRAASIVLAAVAAFGLNVAFVPDTGTLTITGLTLTGIVTALLAVAKQWITQQIIYRAAVKTATR